MADPSPRSARKKKSHLAKLAAKKRESDESSSELGSRSSLLDSSRNNQSDALRRQSLERQSYERLGRHSNEDDNVRGSNRYSRDDDSDEGIGLGAKSNYRNNERQRLPSDRTLNRFQSMKVNGQDSEEESDSDERTSKGEKRNREQNSDGDDLKRDTGHFQTKKKYDDESDEEAGPSRPYSRLADEIESDEMDSDDGNITLGKTFKRDHDKEDMQAQYRQLLQVKDTTDSAASPRMYRRKSPLSMRKSELDPVEEAEVSDDMLDTKSSPFTQPRPSAMSPSPPVHRHFMSNSLSSYKSMDRPTSGQSGFAMSERSMQSTSALPLISTKEARSRWVLCFLVCTMNSQYPSVVLHKEFANVIVYDGD